MVKTFITNKTEYDKLMDYLPVGGVFDTARAFKEESSIGLFLSGLSKVTEEAIFILDALVKSSLPTKSMGEVWAEEWATALGVGSLALPIKYSTDPTNQTVLKNWVYYTMYGFEDILTPGDLNTCFASLALPLEVYQWADAPEEYKTDLYKIVKLTESPTLEAISSYTPTTGREQRVLLVKITGDLFRSGGFPYDFPLPFLDSYAEAPILTFILNLLPFYVTILIKT